MTAAAKPIAFTPMRGFMVASLLLVSAVMYHAQGSDLAGSVTVRSLRAANASQSGPQSCLTREVTTCKGLSCTVHADPC